jgi:Holliday junction resolvase RusA-like endonuclease
MKFEIHIIPHAQVRGRATARIINGRPVGRLHKDRKQEQAEDNLCALLQPYRPASPLEGPLTLRVIATLAVPGSWSERKKADAFAGRIRPTVKPDLDNLVKHLQDCMSQVVFWCDDKQVVNLVAAKYYGRVPSWNIELLHIKEVVK